MTSTTTYTYDVDGKVISERTDNNSDGITDSVITYRYDLTFNSLDNNGDGKFDYVNTSIL